MPPAFRLSRKTGTSPAWKRSTIASRSRTGVPPCRNWCGMPYADRCASSSLAMATYWVNTKHRAVLGDHRGQQLVDQVELLRATSEPRVGLLEEVRRVVADLLEPGEQLEHQPAAGVLVGALDPLHHVAHERLVEHHLLAGEPAAGGRSRSWPAARERSRGRPCGGAAGTGRSGPRTDRPCSGGDRTRSGRPRPCGRRCGCPADPGMRPVEDRPQLGQVVLDRGARSARPSLGRSACAGPWPWRRRGS